MNSRQLSVLGILALIWGCSFLFIRVIVDAGVGAMGMSSLRTLLGFLSLLPFAWFSREGFRQSRRTWLSLAGLGLLNFAVPWTIFGVVGSRIPSGVSSIANSTAPLWIALLAVPFLGQERVRGLKAAGLALGFLGVILLMVEDLANLRGSSPVSIALVLVATLSYGASAVYIRKHMAHVPPVILATGQVGFAAVYLAPLAIGTGSYAGDWQPHVVASALALGFLGSGVAVAAYMWLIQSAGAVSASLVTYLIPPVGVLAGWLALDERIGWNMLAGLVCILGGVGLVQGLPVRRAGAPETPEAVPLAAGGD